MSPECTSTCVPCIYAWIHPPTHVNTAHLKNTGILEIAEAFCLMFLCGSFKLWGNFSFLPGKITKPLCAGTKVTSRESHRLPPSKFFTLWLSEQSSSQGLNKEMLLPQEISQHWLKQCLGSYPWKNSIWWTPSLGTNGIWGGFSAQDRVLEWVDL